MSTEIFNRQQFERALPEPWGYLGFLWGEHCYIVGIGDNQVGVLVRSSIGASGVCSETGENSIRFYLAYYANGGFDQPAAKWEVKGKVQDGYVTRIKGWEDRMWDKINMFRLWRDRAGDCPKHKIPLRFRQSHSKMNPGRVFAVCPMCGENDNGFVWITEAK